MRLDPGAARDSIAPIAGALGMTIERAAWAIHEVMNTGMVAAARAASLERGVDPRRFTLIAFGGAGPIHAAALARGLGVQRVAIPFGAGVGSAAGLLLAEIKFDLVRTFRWLERSGAHASVDEIYRDLESRAFSMAVDAVSPSRAKEMVLTRSADVRYQGQGFELRVPVSAGPFDDAEASRVRARFDQEYLRTYGRSDEREPIEIVNWRLEARLPSHMKELDYSRLRGSGTRSRAERPVYFAGTGYIDCQVVDRYSLRANERIAGPLVVEERESTTIVLPGDTLTVGPRGDLLLDIAGG
jgi:N-methylhydantoinase A